MQRRTFERIPADIKVRFLSGTSEYFGTITNLSENGMFINAKVSFPLKPQLEIIFPLKEKILMVPAKIRCFGKSDDMYNGIGIELLNPPQNYLEFINSLRIVL